MNERLSSSPIDAREQARLLGLLDSLCGYLGSPGDWGYGTALGNFTIQAAEIRNKVRTFVPEVQS